jgi:RNA polymerase sigma factor (sigma-70 family)
MLQPRHDAVLIFSTFIQFDAGTFQSWVPQAVLRQRMQRQATTMPYSVPEWGIHWHQIWQTQPDDRWAREHLFAYLQEACYRAALNIRQRFNQSLPYTQADYFQLAIAETDKVLRGFMPSRNPNLEHYAVFKFGNLIKDGLVKTGLPEASIRSDWSLLQRSSAKRLKDALTTMGFSEGKQMAYLLAWDCFKQRSVPTSPKGDRQSSEPSAEEWHAIAQLYNREQRTQLAPPQVDCDAATLKQWLQDCIQALRSYLSPAMTSLDLPTIADVSFKEQVPSDALTPLESLSQAETAAESHSWQQQIDRLLTAAIAQADPETQDLLQMIYREALTQTEIAQRWQLSQATVSRRIKKLNQVKQAWLLEVGQWAATTLNNSLNPAVLTSMSQAFEEWLTHYYSQSEP